jgi:hypothetical protein
MTKRTGLISFLVFLLFGVVIAAVALSQSSNNPIINNDQTVTPTPDILPSPEAGLTPSPSQAISVSGVIVSISDQPVGFMNARIIRVQEAAGQTLLYVTTDTTIMGIAGQLITLNALNPGDEIQALGQPAEGGVIGSEITVTSEVDVVPTPTTTVTPTPAP